MRSAPAFAASWNTRREPSTFSSRVASLALRIAKARWTTTSAPLTRSRTLSSSVTSPWRYSVFRQRRSAGSNGRLAIPTTRFTARERSRAFTIAIPRSPVGPVTATVRPWSAMSGFLSDRGNPGRPRRLEEGEDQRVQPAALERADLRLEQGPDEERVARQLHALDAGIVCVGRDDQAGRG